MQRQMQFFFGCYKWPKQQDLLYKTEMQFEMQRRNAIANAIFFLRNHRDFLKINDSSNNYQMICENFKLFSKLKWFCLQCVFRFASSQQAVANM
jgi:hypothetical protein